MSVRDGTDTLAGFVRNDLMCGRIVPSRESLLGAARCAAGIFAIVVVALVGASTFGLGYLLGRRARPGSSGTPSASPTTVLVPNVLHLALTRAVQVLDARLAVGKLGTRTGGEPGTIVAQFPPAGTSTRPGSPVDLFVSTSLYPKGAFE
jgi:hypothetical protein